MGAVATRMTVDQFLAIPEREDVREELIEGEIVEMGRGGPLHEKVKANFGRKLAYYFEHNELPGNVFSETMYHLTEQDSPMPDLSVVLSGKLDPGGSGRITVAPEIAIEIVSSETAAFLQKKIRLYLDRGVRVVWVAYPELGIVDVYTRDHVRRLNPSDSLGDPDLLPGFSVPVAPLFELA